MHSRASKFSDFFFSNADKSVLFVCECVPALQNDISTYLENYWCKHPQTAQLDKLFLMFDLILCNGTVWIIQHQYWLLICFNLKICKTSKFPSLQAQISLHKMMESSFYKLFYEYIKQLKIECSAKVKVALTPDRWGEWWGKKIRWGEWGVGSVWQVVDICVGWW